MYFFSFTRFDDHCHLFKTRNDGIHHSSTWINKYLHVDDIWACPCNVYMLYGHTQMSSTYIPEITVDLFSSWTPELFFSRKYLNHYYCRCCIALKYALNVSKLQHQSPCSYHPYHSHIHSTHWAWTGTQTLMLWVYWIVSTNVFDLQCTVCCINYVSSCWAICTKHFQTLDRFSFLSFFFFFFFCRPSGWFLDIVCIYPPICALYWSSILPLQHPRTGSWPAALSAFY